MVICIEIGLFYCFCFEGIGGFNARLRQTRCRDKEEESGAGDGVPATTPTTPGGSDSATTPTTPGVTLTGSLDDKPRRKPQRRKPKSKLVENYPSYLQVCCKFYLPFIFSFYV